MNILFWLWFIILNLLVLLSFTAFAYLLFQNAKRRASIQTLLTRTRSTQKQADKMLVKQLAEEIKNGIIDLILELEYSPSDVQFEFEFKGPESNFAPEYRYDFCIFFRRVYNEELKSNDLLIIGIRKYINKDQAEILVEKGFSEEVEIQGQKIQKFQEHSIAFAITHIRNSILEIRQQFLKVHQ